MQVQEKLETLINWSDLKNVEIDISLLNKSVIIKSRMYVTHEYSHDKLFNRW